ncbi:hypothetical protein FHG87_024566 [Trinorchestia longiramus]|nr:hypothetical protein FHG87_024566 [Trinorchestia longiramus]
MQRGGGGYPPPLGEDLLQSLLGGRSPLQPPDFPPQPSPRKSPPKPPLDPRCSLLLLLDSTNEQLRQLAELPAALATPSVVLRWGNSVGDKGGTNSSFPPLHELLPTARKVSVGVK